MQHIYIDGSLQNLYAGKEEDPTQFLILFKNRFQSPNITTQYQYRIRFSGEIKENFQTIGTADTIIYFIDAKAKKLGYIERVNKETNMKLADFPDYFVSIYEPVEKFAEYRDLLAFTPHFKLTANGNIDKHGKGNIDAYTLSSLFPPPPSAPINTINDELSQTSTNDALQNISQDTFGMRKSLLGLRKDILIITIIQIILLLAILVK